MCLNQFLQVVQLTFRKSGICRQCDDRLDPEFCLSVRRDDMNMDSHLLSGQEIKPVTAYSHNCRTHAIYYIRNWQSCQYRKEQITRPKRGIPALLRPLHLICSVYRTFVPAGELIFCQLAGTCVYSAVCCVGEFVIFQNTIHYVHRLILRI